MRHRSIGLALAFAAALALAACSPPAPVPPAPYKTELTVQELMKHVVDPSADIVWASAGYVIDENGETDLSPKTPAQWALVENNAAIVAESANLLLLPGRAHDDAHWTVFSHRLHETALAAMKAARARDKEAVLKTGGEMYEACTACHQRFILGEK